MDVPFSLARDNSPPRPLKRRKTSGHPLSNAAKEVITKIEPTRAAVEAGKAKIDDHVAYFRNHLAKAGRRTPLDKTRLSIQDCTVLYRDNRHKNGNHFVIYRHNHPRAGVHYDLRLQFSESSSLSFAVQKGLPGIPNPESIGRMTMETRVHNFWNHLIESASHQTGSLLIWDTGTYEVLQRNKEGRNTTRIPSPQTTDDEENRS